MAFTYDPTTDLGRVRLLIGDVTVADPLFTDAELGAIMALAGMSVVGSAAVATQQLATRFSRYADKQVGDLKIAYGQRAKNYLTMASTFRLQGVAQGYMVPTAGGIYADEKETAAADSSLVQPTFTTGMMRNA
jgi:hypothetical protein